LPRFHFYPCFSGEPRERAKRDHVFLQPVKKKEKTQRKEKVWVRVDGMVFQVQLALGD